MIKKKIVIASDCFIPRWDGISRFLIEILPCLTKKYDVTVVVPNFKGDKTELHEVKVVRLPLSYLKIGDYQIAKKKKNMISSALKDADLVWVQTAGIIGNSAINIAKKNKIPIIFIIHSLDHELLVKSLNLKSVFHNQVSYLTKKYLTNIYNKCDLIMYPSSNVSEMLDWNEIKTKKIKVNLGVKTNLFLPSKNKNESKNKIQIDSKDKVIGYCGRLAKEKNIETLMSAFKILKKEYSNIKLLVIGIGLKEYEKKLKKEESVIHVGEKDNVIPYLQAMDIFVLPSLMETTSLATLEAMSCEVTPIATPVGYVKEYIKDEKNGLLFPLKDSKVLAEKIKFLLDNDKERISMGKNARKTVIKDFNFNNSIKNILEILDKV